MQTFDDEFCSIIYALSGDVNLHKEQEEAFKASNYFYDTNDSLFAQSFQARM